MPTTNCVDPLWQDCWPGSFGVPGDSGLCCGGPTEGSPSQSCTGARGQCGFSDHQCGCWTVGLIHYCFWGNSGGNICGCWPEEPPTHGYDPECWHCLGVPSAILVGGPGGTYMPVVGVRRCEFQCYEFPAGSGNRSVRSYCECAVCPVGWTWDPVSGVCCDANGPCPEHTCWCTNTHTCVPCDNKCRCKYVWNCYVDCTPPPCATQLGCAWSEDLCVWTCATPVCNYNEHWDPHICDCVPCPSGKCWCDGVNACINCKVPPCSTELNCTWSHALCTWICDTNSCPAGQHWNECSVCRCVPDCPAGQQWCGPNAGGSCVSAATPQCHDQLKCCWSEIDCAWHCDDPAVVCTDGTWDPVTCKCTYPEGPWIRQTNDGMLMRVRRQLDGIHFSRSDKNRTPFVTDVIVISDPLAQRPRFDVDPTDRRIYLVIQHSGSTKSLFSDGNGDDGYWSTTLVTEIVGGLKPDICVDKHVFFRLITARVSTHYEGVRHEPDGTTVGPFHLQVHGGGDLVLDDVPHHIESADDEPGLLVMAAVQGGADATLRSYDDGVTWEVI